MSKRTPDRRSEPLGLAILHGLQSKSVYGGTVPPAEVQQRRAKNRVAKVSRRQNRAR